MHYNINFPHLGIHLEHVGKSITVFGFDIAYYGIIIGCAILIGFLIATSEAKRTRQNPEDYLDMGIIGVVCGIVGARLYYVAFSWDMYKDNLLQVFNLRGGGLAIYGGVIGAVLTLLVYTRVKKISFFSMADTGCLGLITGQIIGRWGNFFNCEAFGGYTENLFAMRIRRSLVNENMISQDLLNHLIVENGVEYIQVHPTFLYESLWNLGLLLFMLWYRKR